MITSRCNRCGQNKRNAGEFCQKCIDRYSPEDWDAWLQYQKPFCQQCGKSIEWATPGYTATGRTRFCSKTCSNLAMSKIKESDWPELVRLYRDEHLTSNQIGKLYGCTGTVILKVLRRFEVLRYAKPGAANGMYGQTHTPAAVEKIREAHRKQFSSEAARQQHGELTAQQIKDGRTGKSFNKLETAFAAILDSIGASYEWQHKLGRYVFDFLLHGPNILIETHGQFWHADPRFYDRSKLRAVQTSNLANDIRKEAAARAAGFKFVCYWEHDIHNDPDWVKADLIAVLGNCE